MHTPIILGIDPGYGITGYAFIRDLGNNQFEVLNYGVITTPADIPFVERLRTIAHDLNILIKRYSPAVAGVEQIYFYNNAKTAIDVGQARGAMLLTLTEHNIPIIELTPLQVKQGLTGDGNADKAQVQKMVTLLLKLSSIPTPDDAADALAIAMVTAQRYATSKQQKTLNHSLRSAESS